MFGNLTRDGKCRALPKHFKIFGTYLTFEILKFTFIRSIPLDADAVFVAVVRFWVRVQSKPFFGVRVWVRVRSKNIFRMRVRARVRSKNIFWVRVRVRSHKRQRVRVRERVRC